MTTLPSSQSGIKHSFEMITRSFLQPPGLAFSSILDAASIRQAFEQEDACFADDAIFSTEIVLWAFLAQTLREGKETGEPALLRRILETFDKRDVVVFDRYYCSYMMLAMLIGQGVDVCTRLHSNRASDFRRGRRLGPDDHLITWYRPAKPAWMSVQEYETIPEKLELRELRFDVKELGRRTQTITVITTLTDPRRYPKEEIANLYGFRWNVELDILQIKQTLNLDHLRCKSPEMVSREVWVTLVAYNLIRKLIATAAVVHDKQPRRLGFTRACQTVLVSWILFSTESCYDAAAMQAHLLASIAANEVANRPGRIEPRVLKRRRHRYPLMQCSRQKWRTKCEKT